MMYVCLFMYVCLHVCMFGARLMCMMYSMARAGQHVRLSHKHCKPCAKHARAPPPRARTCLNDFHLVEFSHQPAGETSRTTNNELHGTGWATRAPVTQTLQTVRQRYPGTTATCLYRFARFPSCGIFTPTRTIPVKQRVETTG